MKKTITSSFLCVNGIKQVCRIPRTVIALLTSTCNSQKYLKVGLTVLADIIEAHEFFRVFKTWDLVPVGFLLTCFMI